MNPLLLWGNKGIIRGFHFLDPLRGFGKGTVVFIGPFLGFHVSFRESYASSASSAPMSPFFQGKFRV